MRSTVPTKLDEISTNSLNYVPYVLYPTCFRQDLKMQGFLQVKLNYTPTYILVKICHEEGVYLNELVLI